MASYNTFSGWAPIEPLRRMMLAFMEGCQDNTDERAGQAITYLKFLRDSGAAYFRDNPAASKALDQMARTERYFVVHDYPPPTMEPFYCADVAEALGKTGLAFAGTHPAFRNYSKFTAPPKFADLLASLENRMALESQIDNITNTHSRTDIFVKPAATALADEDRPRLFEPMRFGSLEAGGAIPSDTTLGRYPIAYFAPIYGPLMDRLAQGAPSIGELAQSNELVGYLAAYITKAVNFLVLGGHFRPFAALIFEALDDAGPEGAAEAIWRRLEARGQSLEGEGGTLTGRDAHLDAIAGEIDTLCRGQRVKLAELRIADLLA